MLKDDILYNADLKYARQYTLDDLAWPKQSSKLGELFFISYSYRYKRE